MADARMSLPVVRHFGETTRRDLWWVQPLVVFLGLSTFIVYSTWAAFQGKHYTYGPYLSPFYSPELFYSPTDLTDGMKGYSKEQIDRAIDQAKDHHWIGLKPGWWPTWLLFSPALLILWMPGGFRFTCYYYRGAYYKAFWADPPNCAVGEPRKSYLGENSLPLILQNIHRYFLYIALVFIALLFWDFLRGCWFDGRFGIHVGTLVLLVNVTLLGGYTFGCHSFRHLIGGRLDQLSSAPTQKRIYDCVSCLNRKHMVWAWISLFWVGFTDLYVRMCSMGYWTDWRIIGA